MIKLRKSSYQSLSPSLLSQLYVQFRKWSRQNFSSLLPSSLSSEISSLLSISTSELISSSLITLYSSMCSSASLHLISWKISSISLLLILYRPFLIKSIFLLSPIDNSWEYVTLSNLIPVFRTCWSLTSTDSFVL